MGWNIDWITIRQVHSDSATVGKNLCVWLDPATGERLTETVGRLSHEGSFSTSVSIRAYKGVVEWSGNPSRWGRPDNVWGYSTLDQAMTVVNGHMRALGLPEFSASAVALRDRRSQLDNGWLTTGASLTRVDLAWNFFAGDAKSLSAYIRAASSATYRGKPSKASATGCSWGQAKTTTLVCYDKGQELAAHTRKPPKQKGMKPTPVEEEAIKAWHYRQRLAEWSREHGLGRWEIRLGRNTLRQLGLRSLDEWSDAAAREYCEKRRNDVRVGAMTGLDRAFEAFVAAEYTERQASTLSGLVARWYMGEDVQQGLSRATFYRHHAAIKAVMGIDLRSKPDVAVLNTKVREVTLTPAVPPSWYRHAA
jgi:hypothetical protein